MKIVDIITNGAKQPEYTQTFYVVDDVPPKLYEFVGPGKNLLVGYDESKTLYDCLQYGLPSGRFYAFGGWKFDLPMRDGTTTHCYGQYWDGGPKAIGEKLGVELGRVSLNSKKRLEDCFVFYGHYVDVQKFDELIRQFMSENPGYQPKDYREYDKKMKAAKRQRRDDQHE